MKEDTVLQEIPNPQAKGKKELLADFLWTFVRVSEKYSMLITPACKLLPEGIF